MHEFTQINETEKINNFPFDDVENFTSRKNITVFGKQLQLHECLIRTA